MNRRPSSMPISHWVRDAAPETSQQLVRRGACPACQCVALTFAHDVDGCAGPVAECARCHWNDYDERQAAHVSGLDGDPGYSTGFD